MSWAFLPLLVNMQTWWTVYGLRSHSPWTFLEFFVILLQPITLYLLSVSGVGVVASREGVHKTLAYSTLLASLAYVALLFYSLR